MGKLTLRGFRTVHGEQMLAQIAEQTALGRSSLRHIKAFLAGVFKQAKRLGILDGINPIQDVSIPRTPRPRRNPRPQSGRSDTDSLFPRRAGENNRAHGCADGTPQRRDARLVLGRLVRRVIVPALTRCGVCGEAESEHAKDGHEFKLDTSIPGWHAFRRGLATNLHALGVKDKDIQSILRHGKLGLTINVYIKSVTESQVNALDVLNAKLEKETNNNPATGTPRLAN